MAQVQLLDDVVHILPPALMHVDNVPALLRWLPRASFIKSAFQALCINEFKGMEFEAAADGDSGATGGGGGGMRTGEKVRAG